MNSEKKYCEKCSRGWIALSSNEPCPFCRVASLENAVDALLPRLNIITALRRHGQPHRPDAVDRIYEFQLVLEELMQDKTRHVRPEFFIGAAYYPQKGEADFIFESEAGNLVITQKVDPALGEFIAKMFYPCVYMTAALHANGSVGIRRVLRDMQQWLQEPAECETLKAKAIDRHNVQDWYTSLMNVLKGGGTL